MPRKRRIVGKRKTVPQDWKSKFGFEDVITTEHDLRGAAGKPSFWFQNKILTKLDIHCRHFIAASPFVVIASAGAAGSIDTSPKGDAPGFVQILDDCTLALPDRSGNRRFDTFHNLLENPNFPAGAKRCGLAARRLLFVISCCESLWRLREGCRTSRSSRLSSAPFSIAARALHDRNYGR